MPTQTSTRHSEVSQHLYFQLMGLFSSFFFFLVYYTQKLDQVIIDYTCLHCCWFWDISTATNHFRQHVFTSSSDEKMPSCRSQECIKINLYNILNSDIASRLVREQSKALRDQFNIIHSPRIKVQGIWETELNIKTSFNYTLVNTKRI